jgi:hypothetical protein
MVDPLTLAGFPVTLSAQDFEEIQGPVKAVLAWLALCYQEDMTDSITSFFAS